jgi:hypothetical protein
MARASRTGKPSTKRVAFRVSDAEHAELAEATAELELDWSEFIRLAVGDALADWRERRVFERRQVTVPVDVERRSGQDRRGGT